MIDVKRLANEAESYANEHAKDVSIWKDVAQERFADLLLEEAAKAVDKRLHAGDVIRALKVKP